MYLLETFRVTTETGPVTPVGFITCERHDGSTYRMTVMGRVDHIDNIAQQVYQNLERENINEQT